MLDKMKRTLRTLLKYVIRWLQLLASACPRFSSWIRNKQQRDMQSNADLTSVVDFRHVPLTEVESFWNRRPCNVRHSPAPVGTRKYFDDVERRKYLVEPHILAFAQFEHWSNKDVLEIGCGIGTAAVSFARVGARYVGIDLSSESVVLARQRLRVYDLPGEIHQCNAEQLASQTLTADRKFDLVYSFGVIHHTPHPERIIGEIKKLLRPGGTLKIMVYAKISFKLFWIMRETGVWDLSKIDALLAKYSEAQVGCPVTYTYTCDGVRELLGPEFSVQELYKDHIFRYELDSYRNHTAYVVQDMWKHVSADTIRALERELGWHVMCTATFTGSG